LHSQQHKPYYNLEQRNKRLDKEIPQDNLRTKNYNKYPASNPEHYQANRHNKQSASRYQNHITTNKRNS